MRLQKEAKGREGKEGGRPGKMKRVPGEAWVAVSSHYLEG